MAKVGTSRGTGRSTGKKVARAARTGGGRTKRNNTSLMFPAVVTVITVLGVLLIALSKHDRRPDHAHPRIGDHWHAAYAVDVCGTFLPAIQTQTDPLGVHTHGDGVIHIHPSSPKSAGKRATLQVFLDAVGAKITSSEIRLPNQPVKRDGQKCDGKPAEVQVKVWPSRSNDAVGRLVTGPPGKIRLKENQLITVAFLPKGADIPKPPSEGELSKLSDVAPPASPTPSIPVPGGATPAPAGGTPAPAGGTPAPAGAAPAPGNGTPSPGNPTPPPAP